MIEVEELQQMQRGQVIVDGEGDGFEIVDVCPAERRFSARIPHRNHSPFNGGAVVAYDWDAEGNIYYHGDKALQSESTHLADAIFTKEQVIALCRGTSPEMAEEVAGWSDVEHFELLGDELFAYCDGEPLYDSIKVPTLFVKWPEESPA